MRKILPLLFLVLAIAGTGGRAQHSKSKSDDPVGGKIQITLPRPKSMNRASDRRQPPKISLQLVTRNDDGAWFYNPARYSQRLDVVRFAVAFEPADLGPERERLAQQAKSTEGAFLYRYGYIGTIYAADMICSNGRFRFIDFVDVTADKIINAENATGEWAEWRDADGTPWQKVRAMVCKGV